MLLIVAVRFFETHYS